jgi:hypothetical protein
VQCEAVIGTPQKLLISITDILQEMEEEIRNANYGAILRKKDKS